MQKILDYLSWGFIAVFAAPTVLIMASWNSVPGDSMYGVKRMSEQALLAIARPSYDAQTTLSSQYTKRRMDEAKILLAKNKSSEGLSYLSQQVAATKLMIQNAPTREKKQEAAKKYIATLQSVSQELKAQQRVTTASVPRVSAPVRVAPVNQQTNQQQQLQSQLQQQSQQLQQLQAQLQQAQSQSQTQQAQQLQAQVQQQAQLIQQIQTQIQQQAAAQQVQPTSALVMSPAPVQESSQNMQQPQDQETIDANISNADAQVQQTIAELQVIAQDTSSGGSNENLIDTSNNGINGQGNENENRDTGKGNGSIESK